MPSNININNNGPSFASISTSVSPPLSTSYWGVGSSSAPTGQKTQLLWVDRNEGITKGESWEFTSSFTFEGVSIQLQEYLTGTTASSTLTVQIVAGGKSTGFQSNDTSLPFTDPQGCNWMISASFVLKGSYDDVTYNISPQ